MPSKRKSDTFTSKIPWENVSANTLRPLCRDIAGPSAGQLTKQAMISLLLDIEQHGVDIAIEKLANSGEAPKPSKPTFDLPTTSRARTTSLKRKEPEPAPVEDDDDDEEEQADADSGALPYNTRHKGQKRVRVVAPPLPKVSSPRRKSTTSRATKKDVHEESTDAPGATSVTPVKRGRGRSRKSDTTAAPANAKRTAPTSGKSDAASGSVAKRGPGRPTSRRSVPSKPASLKKASTGKQIFDGIELKRAKTRETTEDDADGEPEDEEDDNPMIIPSGETSSLGSSNKENHQEPPMVFMEREEIITFEVVNTQVSLAEAINLSHNPATA